MGVRNRKRRSQNLVFRLFDNEDAESDLSVLSMFGKTFYFIYFISIGETTVIGHHGLIYQQNLKSKRKILFSRLKCLYNV